MKGVFYFSDLYARDTYIRDKAPSLDTAGKLSHSQVKSSRLPVSIVHNGRNGRWVAIPRAFQRHDVSVCGFANLL
jgi:hypothetical protein